MILNLNKYGGANDGLYFNRKDLAGYFCYQVKITCASSHVVATNDIYISDDSIDTLFNGLNDFIKGKTKEFFGKMVKKEMIPPHA